MNLSLLARHPTLFSVLCGTLAVSSSLSIGLGQLKSLSDISWLDVLGEGSLGLLSIVWVFFLLISRPPGKVTSALVIGLCCFLFSASLDFFDEFLTYQDAATGLSMIESIPAAIGMLIMSYALYQWHQEQLVLNQQLRRREHDLRQHDQIDYITKLYGADYMRGQIHNKLTAPPHSDFSIVMLDIDNFDQFNRKFGHAEGDRLLRQISELIIMNLRSSDLACRYAGDRFVLLLPNTGQTVALELAEQVRQAIFHLAYKPDQHPQAIYHNLTFAIDSVRPGDTTDNIIDRVNRSLDASKQLLYPSEVAL